MPIFRIHHITKYEYDRNVKESINEIKIFPFSCNEQETLQHDLIITGQPDMHIYHDYWGNKIGIFNLLAAHKELVIESKLVVRTISPLQERTEIPSGWAALGKEVSGSLRLMELASAKAVSSQSKIDKIARSILDKKKDAAETVGMCNEYIYNNFEYIKGITNIETTVDEILDKGAGVCQDFAHVMLQLLRTMKIPSRYVSGYICPNKNGMRGEGATHAWVEVWLPDQEWVGVDPTNNIWVTNSHIKLAVGRNFNDCTPIKGAFKGPAREKLSVYVSIGYEDGQVFNESNDVKMVPQENLPKEEILDESFASQQQ
jgi:transglutaminase-like putative cysteine protease